MARPSSSRSAGVRLNFDLPSSPPSGTTYPPWSTPAEGYLTWLASGLPAAQANTVVGVGLTPKEAREVVFAVRDALLAVGALPPNSPILQQLFASPRRESLMRLTREFVSHVRGQFTEPSTEQDLVALGTRVPLRHSTMMISWMIVRGGVAYFELYVSPNTSGE